MLTLLQMLVSALLALIAMLAEMVTTAPAQEPAAHATGELSGVDAPALHTGSPAVPRLVQLSGEPWPAGRVPLLSGGGQMSLARFQHFVPAAVNEIRAPLNSAGTQEARIAERLRDAAKSHRQFIVIHRCSRSPQPAEAGEQPEATFVWTTAQQG